MNAPVFQEHKRDSFHDYFEMTRSTRDILAELDYRLDFQELSFPQTVSVDPKTVDRLKNFYRRLAPKIALHSETAKRESVIAPVLHEVVLQTEAQLNIEYPIEVELRLNGSIDYLLTTQKTRLVIEAKKGDLDRGFNQLAAEMIAVDKHETSRAEGVFYGAVTIGEVWRFASLDRSRKIVARDANLYRFPQDAQDVLGILINLLS